MHKAMMDFIVLGLPRSGTTWIANWLTTDRTLCMHDPFSYGMPETWARDERRFGISCTMAHFFPDWLERFDCPVAVIERDTMACMVSLDEMGLGNDTKRMSVIKASIDRVYGRRWQFDDLWNEETARNLWDFLLPGISFDTLRYRQLRNMQVQPYMPRWEMKPGVFESMRGD